METDTPRELGVDKESSAVETSEDRDVPEEPEACDSGSERGDWDAELDEEEEDWHEPGDEERTKARGGHVCPEPQVTLPSSISPRLRDILARSRLSSRREGDGVEEGADNSGPPLHVLSEVMYVEVVLEPLPEEVELLVFQEFDEVK